MFSDTHFHFENFCSQGINGSETLLKMAENDCFFGLDIGTKNDDLLHRQESVKNSILQIKDGVLQKKCFDFMYFAAGIWPSPEEIQNREESMKNLKEQVEKASKNDDSSNPLHSKIIAVGECGLDHHWNPSGVDGRREADFDKKMYEGERELFEMQLEYAKSLNLPVIIHSRDAFEDTLECIKNVGYNKGIIHCYSYGLKEAEEFLSLGWYISFSGSVTYTKKSKMEQMELLIKSIPDKKILCETDAPYLAPVPFRGQTNTPVLVKNTYDFAAKIRSTTPKDLSSLVDSNIKDLFNLAE